MIVIAVNELNKYYGSHHILKGMSFEVYHGEKIGLLGKNGAGKTTLFRVIAQDEFYESGTISIASGKKIEVLAQIPDFGAEDTVEQILYSSFQEVMNLHHAMKKIEGDADPAVLQRYGTLLEEYERLGGYEIEYQIEKICNGMNITHKRRQSPFHLLSGGEKTRVNLARILLRQCHILLLDEPTNHLDLASLDWLEGFLHDFPGTVIVISHDRTFLDNVVTRIIEVEEGKAHFYSGNYSWYAVEKQQRILSQSQQYQRQQKEIKRIEDRAKWFVEQNRFTTKHHAILSRIDHMEKIDKPITRRKVSEDFGREGHVAKELVSLDMVSKSYGSKVLLEDVCLTIGRNDRIALIGENGCGKTTLLRMILEEEACDQGTIKVSSNVKVAYMPQIITFPHETATILETLQYAFDYVEGKARNILAGFHFRADEVTKKVSALSGGEKSRLKLCMLMQQDINFMILDEPTNHLDIVSREWIEKAIENWAGTMLFISHDRYFLNKFASRIWAMKDGSITDFLGGFQEYLENVAKKKPNRPSDKNTKKRNSVREEACTFKEKRFVSKKGQPSSSKEKSPETLIQEAEEALVQIDEQILLETNLNDYEKLATLYEEKQKLEIQIEALLQQWLEESEEKR